MYQFLLVIVLLYCSGAQAQHNELRATNSWDATMLAYFTTQQNGDGTYYGPYGGGGHCTLDPYPQMFENGLINNTVAIATSEYSNSNTCGMCIKVTTNGVGSGANPIPSPLLVFVNDECPSCSSGDLDFGINGDGRWDISWVAVDCPVGNQNIQYFFQGSNNYYIKMQVRNSRVPVQNVYVVFEGNDVALVRQPDNFFQSPGSPNIFPLNTFTVKVQSIAGDIVTDQVTLVASGAVDGNVQFPPSSFPGVPTPSPTSAPTPATSGDPTTAPTPAPTPTASASPTPATSGAPTPAPTQAPTPNPTPSTTTTGPSYIAAAAPSAQISILVLVLLIFFQF